jgi:hypothetical protein
MMIAGMVTTVAICAWSRPVDYGHSPWADRVAKTQLPNEILRSDGLFLLYGWPTTYLIPDFASSARFFDIYMLEDPQNAMGQTFKRVLMSEKRTMYSIQGAPLSADSLKFLNNFDLRQDGIDCRHFPSFVGARHIGLALCPVYPNTTGAKTAAATYPIGRTIVFGRPGRNSIFYETSGWSVENDVGRAWDPSATELHLKLELMQTPPEHIVIKVGLVVPSGQCNFGITVNAEKIAMAVAPEHCARGKLDIAVPSGIAGADGLLDIGLVRPLPMSAADQPIIISNVTIQAL